MADYANITYETKGRLAYVTINRPDRRNAIDPNTSRELRDAFEAFKSDENVWVAILTGSGEQAFSAGADLVAMAEAFAGGAEGPRYDVPFGGITQACDIRVAAEHASFGLPEPKRAIIPAAGGTQRLPRAVPLAFAMELLLTGNRFDAQTALRFGLVSRVVPADRLMATAEEIAAGVLECGPLAVRAIKQAAMQGREMSLEDGLKLESQMAGRVFQSEDAREGPTAFAQKRKPEYKGQ